MIDHITFRVSDMEKSIAFYVAALKPLGYTLNFDMIFDGVRIVGFGKDGKNTTWFSGAKPVGGPVHFAWLANSQKEVDQFYKAAIKAGGKDNGKPGPRPMYDENYYAAFVFDPDGNNIEAVFHG